jgi:ABC-2 type transport system ATP-binding protein
MIQIKNMSFGYGKQLIFDGFNLHIKKGEAVLMTGINGIGKTTLLRLMAGVLLPRSGKIEYAPELGMNPKMKIGFISDQVRLYEDMKLQEAIAFHSSAYGITEFDRSLLEKTRLSMDKKIKELSVGQKLIFHLSMIISARPEVLLIDEIIHSIDAYLREIFIRSLLELMSERQVTLVMVNLNYHDIEKIPERIILLRNGQIAVDETIDDLKRKVKKVVTTGNLPETLPVLFTSTYADMNEYYLYPMEEKQEALSSGESEIKVLDLNLNDIIKAFIGGEYV